MSNLRRGIAIYDAHVGYEIKVVDGKSLKVPTHSEAALTAIMQFARDFLKSGDTFLAGGDQLDIASISEHNRGKPRLVEGLRLTDEYDELNRLILKDLDQFWAEGIKKVWITGNHENRVRRYLEANPGVTGLVEPEVYLSLAQRGWILQPEEVPYQDGKLGHTHGHGIFPRGKCKDPAAKLVYHYRRSMVCGHVHGGYLSPDVTPADAKDFHVGVISPAAGQVNPGYRLNAPANYNRGFVYWYVRPDDSFNVYIVQMVDDVFTVEGKTYGAAEPPESPEYREYLRQNRKEVKSWPGWMKDGAHGVSVEPTTRPEGPCGACGGPVHTDVFSVCEREAEPPAPRYELFGRPVFMSNNPGPDPVATFGPLTAGSTKQSASPTRESALDTQVKPVVPLVLTESHEKALRAFAAKGRASVNTIRTECGFYGPKAQRIFGELKAAGLLKEWGV